MNIFKYLYFFIQIKKTDSTKQKLEIIKGTKMAIRCENLSKTFVHRRKIPIEKKLFAVDGINLEIPKGTIYGFLGPNGAGKTTTIKMIIGALNPTSGKIFINDISLENNFQEALKSIGYIPENSQAYIQEVTSYKYVTFMGMIKGLSRESAKKEAKEKLHFVNLKRELDKTIGKLSQGQKQRVGLAQALIGDPDILICDEPTANMDPIGKSEVAELLRVLKQQGKTVFVSSHLLAEIQPIIDMISVINLGKITVSGTVSELLDRFKARVFFLSVNNLEKMKERLSTFEIIDEVIDYRYGLQIHTNDPNGLCKLIPKVIADEGLIQYEFKSELSSLERIFFGAIPSSFLEEENYE